MREVGMKALCAAVFWGFAFLSASAGEPVVWMGWAHEPDDFLLRRGSAGTGGTYGKWLPKCYARIHSEELFDKAADLGVNLIYAHYFKGFGLEHEKANMEKTREIVRLAHARGIKVLGYCSFGALFRETMMDEADDFDDWLRRDSRGEVVPYGNVQYYRPWTCHTSTRYIDYICRVVDYGLDHVGLDGFHFDNGEVGDCFCSRCRGLLREWLAENVPDPRPLCGLASFRHAMMPPHADGVKREPKIMRDPMALWTLRFRHDTHDRRAVGTVFGHVRRKPGALVAYNSGLCRDTFGMASAYGPNAMSADFHFAENGEAIRTESGTNRTQVLAYKMGRRFGYRVLNATSYGPSATANPEAARRQLAEGMMFGNIAGASWLTRFKMKGDRMAIDDKPVFDAMKEAIAYYRANSDVYSGEPTATVRLLYSPDSYYGWSGYYSKSFMDFRRTAARLVDAAIPFSVATPDEIAGLPAGSVIVLADMPFARRSEYEAIKAAAVRGVRIVRTGEYGRYDENGMEYEIDDPMRNLADVPGVEPSLPEDRAVVVRDASGGKANVIVETQVRHDGAFVLHLLSPDSSAKACQLVVECAEAKGKAALYSFDQSCRLASVEPLAGGGTRLVLDGFCAMGSLVFK